MLGGAYLCGCAVTLLPEIASRPSPLARLRQDPAPARHESKAAMTARSDGSGSRVRGRATRKFTRSSAKNPQEQARRVAWGQKWGSIIRAESEKIMRGTR